MALSDNRRLYDLSARLAVYVEGVKANQTREFNASLREVAFVLQKLLGNVRFKTLDGLSKAQLNVLLLNLRASQSKIYSEYTNKVMEQLQEFMTADLEVNRRIWTTAAIEQDEDEEPASPAAISDRSAIQWIEENHNNSNLFLPIAAVTGATDGAWTRAVNSPIPANGLYLVPFLKTFSVSAQSSVENLIRQAWANKLSVEETLKLLVGDGANRQGTSSQLQRIQMQNAAVVHTSYAHIAAIATAGASAVAFSRYQWHSVLDNKTTVICQGRNGKIYVYGKGPLPPGHIHCRSHITPYNGGKDVERETFYAWMLAQAPGFQEDVLTEEIMNKIQSGKIRATDISEFEVFKPLTIEQFRKKVREILSRRYGVTA